MHNMAVAPTDFTGRNMVEGLARVVAVKSGRAVLEIEPKSDCASCAAKAGCGSLGRSGGHIVQRFSLADSFDARIGERVVVGIPEGALVRASAIAYILPLCAMVLAAVLANWLGAADGLAALAALGGIVAGFLVARIRARKLAAEGTLVPVYLRPAAPMSGCGYSRLQ